MKAWGWLVLLAFGCSSEDPSTAKTRGYLGDVCAAASDCEGLAEESANLKQYDGFAVECLPDALGKRRCSFVCDGVHDNQIEQGCYALGGTCPNNGQCVLE